MCKLKTCHTDTWECQCTLDVYVHLWGIGVIFNKNDPVTSCPATSLSQKPSLHLPSPHLYISAWPVTSPTGAYEWNVSLCIPQYLRRRQVYRMGSHKMRGPHSKFWRCPLGWNRCGGGYLQVREEKVASWKWRQLFSSKSEKKWLKERRERAERKHSNLRFLSLLPLLQPINPLFFSISCLDFLTFPL